MTRVPVWFTVLAAVALLWNLAGLFAVVADLRLSAADIAALPAEQQALYAARPFWSVVASVVAVGGGTLGCLGLLLRRRWSLLLLYASLTGIVIQDVWIFLIAGAPPGIPSRRAGVRSVCHFPGANCSTTRGSVSCCYRPSCAPPGPFSAICCSIRTALSFRSNQSPTIRIGATAGRSSRSCTARIPAACFHAPSICWEGLI